MFFKYFYIMGIIRAIKFFCAFIACGSLFLSITTFLDYNISLEPKALKILFVIIIVFVISGLLCVFIPSDTAIKGLMMDKFLEQKQIQYITKETIEYFLNKIQ